MKAFPASGGNGTGRMVGNSVRTVRGARWVLGIPGWGHSVKYRTVQPLCHTVKRIQNNIDYKQ